MRAVSDRWLSAIRGSHKAVFEAIVCEPDQTGVEPDGTTVPVTGGDVTYDIESDVLATAEVGVQGLDLFPVDPGDLLAPYGNELYLRRGIDYGGGVVEWVGLGYFRINATEQDDVLGGDLRVSCQDRMWRIIRFDSSPRSFSRLETYGQVVALVVSAPAQAVPGATIEWDDPAVRDTPIGRDTYLEGNSYQFLDELIRSRAKIWYWDHRGVLVIRTAPDTSSPVWDVNAGTDGVLVSAGQSINDEGVFNVVFVQGASPDPPAIQGAPSSTARDEDPDSPTYWLGKFGRSVLLVNEPLATTGAQTLELARSLVRQYIGLPYSLNFSAIPNAALEPYDPIRVRFPGRDRVHILRRLTIPLSVNAAMTADTKEYVQAEEGI